MLREVPPEPVAEPVPPPAPAPSWHSSIVIALRRVQRYSAYGITAFAGLHTTSTVLLPPFSVGWADSTLLAGRELYQTELGELILFSSMASHVTSGLLLHAMRVVNHYRDFGELRWFATKQTVSGYLLVALAGVHVAVMRWGPLKALGDSSLISLEYVTYGLCSRPVVTAASLLGLVYAAGAHIIPGLRRYLGVRMSKFRESMLVATGVVWSIAALFTLRRQEVVRGWMAEQFELAYSVFC